MSTSPHRTARIYVQGAVRLAGVVLLVVAAIQFARGLLLLFMNYDQSWAMDWRAPVDLGGRLAITLAAGIWLLTKSHMITRWVVPIRPGRCLVCDYPLEDGRCPECGYDEPSGRHETGSDAS